MNNHRLVWIVQALAVSLLAMVTSVCGCACLNKQAEIRAHAERARQNCFRSLITLNLASVIQNEKEFEEFCVVINAAFACLNHTMVNYSHVAFIRKNRMMLDLARGLKAKVCMKSNGSHAAQEYGRCHNHTLFDQCMPPEETAAGLSGAKELCRQLQQQHNCYISWTKSKCSPEGREHYETMHNLSMKALCRSSSISGGFTMILQVAFFAILCCIQSLHVHSTVSHI